MNKEDLLTAGQAISQVAKSLESLAEAHANQQPEAPASFSFLMMTPGGFEVMATVRNGELAKLISSFPEFETAMLAAGYTPVHRYHKPAASPLPTESQPAAAPPPAPPPAAEPAAAALPTANGHHPSQMPPPTVAPDWYQPDNDFPQMPPQNAEPFSYKPETLFGEKKDNGKIYWKIKGGEFNEFGVRVWDEVLEQAGIPVSQLAPGTHYNLDGYAYVTYVTNQNGNPKKITQLVRK